MVSLGLYAQGTVNFANTDTTKVIDATDGQPVTAGDGIRAGLYWAAVGSTDFVQIGNVATVGVPVTGVFSGGGRTTGPATAGGAMAQFQVRAWELAYGTTYEAAIAAANMNGRPTKRGISNTITIATGNPSGTPPTTPTSLTGLTGFTVDVPEPSVIALGVIGAGALLLLRRRK